MSRISDEDACRLLQTAQDSVSNSYSPYSNYAVGASVLTKTGNIATGVNIENAAYSAGICAERIAIGSALSQGFSDILAVAVYSAKGDISPCGICRQFISEFGGDVKVIFQWQGKLRQIAIKELLPYSFSSKHLK